MIILIMIVNAGQASFCCYITTILINNYYLDLLLSLYSNCNTCIRRYSSCGQHDSNLLDLSARPQE